MIYCKLIFKYDIVQWFLRLCPYVDSHCLITVCSFIFGCTGSVFAAWAFFSCAKWGLLCCDAWASHCSDFSCCRAQALGTQASVVAASRLRSCGAQAELLWSMWDLPRPGTEPVSPTLVGGLLTTGPVGKSLDWHC